MDYYWQAIGGQIEIFSRQQSIEEILVSPETRPELKQKLEYIQQVRAFASHELYLPDNNSYRSFVDVERPYLVWNVFAAPGLSLKPYQSCFPVAGCLAYRGYFNKNDAQAFAHELKQQDYDVFVAGISAYSTLGWFDDPVPSTIMHYSNAHLAGLIFHELAHQKVYIKDDTAFNESFAMSVELAGVKQWMEQTGDPALHIQYKNENEHREQFIALLMRTRQKLNKLYLSDEINKLDNKKKILEKLKTEYDQLKKDWNANSHYDGYMKQDLNNAHFISVGLYHRYIPAFEALRKQSNNWPEFFEQVRQLGDLPKEKRELKLQQLSERKI
ncbi:MAG: aminopeptidase [Gammaproteobacteria bacterium]|nr:aminopeptidase [Gammaproteobacteria bacterium]